MENLSKLNLVELNQVEMKAVEGGIWMVILELAAGALIGAALTQDFDKLKEAYQVGYEAGKR